MRIAILSDIHSNIQALERALSIVDVSNIDAVYCLGDIVGYGAKPNECISLIRKYVSPCVVGNHDLAAVNPSDSVPLPRAGKKAAKWTHNVLTDENIEFLSNLPYTLKNDFCIIVHANPINPGEWEYLDTPEIARAAFDHFPTRICFVGHTHVPVVLAHDLKTFKVNATDRFIINSGSVGQPRDGNPRLSFGILDTDNWSYKNIRAEYDVEAAAKDILDAGLPSSLARRLPIGV